MCKISKTKRFTLILSSLAILLSCTACGSSTDDNFIDSSLIVPTETEYETAMVEFGVFETNTTPTVSTVYSYNEKIYAEEECYFVEYLVAKGDIVEQGDPLVSYTTDGSSVDLEEKKLELARLESSYSSAITSYNSNLTYQKELLKTLESGSYSYKIQALNIEQIQVEHKEYLLQTNQSIENMEEEIAELEESLDIQYVYAPIGGEVAEIQLITAEEKLDVRSLLLTITTYDSFLLVSETSDGFRYGDFVDIEVGTGSEAIYIVGKVVANPEILSTDLSDSLTYIQIDYEASGITEEELDLTMKYIKVTAKNVYIEDALIVSADAVSEDDNGFYVYLLEDDAVKKRYITSTYYNSNYYCVDSGLTLGQTVIIE